MTAPAAPLTANGVRTAFGASLRRLRAGRGWSQVRLSALSGVSQATISDAEAGHREVSLYTAVTLAQALGSGLDAMLCEGFTCAEKSGQENSRGFVS